MKVKAIHQIIGETTIEPGQVAEMSQEEAERLISCGAAEACDPEPEPEPDTAFEQAGHSKRKK